MDRILGARHCGHVDQSIRVRRARESSAARACSRQTIARRRDTDDRLPSLGGLCIALRIPGCRFRLADRRRTAWSQYARPPALPMPGASARRRGYPPSCSHAAAKPGIMTHWSGLERVSSGSLNWCTRRPVQALTAVVAVVLLCGAADVQALCSTCRRGVRVALEGRGRASPAAIRDQGVAQPQRLPCLDHASGSTGSDASPGRSFEIEHPGGLGVGSGSGLWPNLRQ